MITVMLYPTGCLVETNDTAGRKNHYRQCFFRAVGYNSGNQGVCAFRGHEWSLEAMNGIKSSGDWIACARKCEPQGRVSPVDGSTRVMGAATPKEPGAAR